MFVGMDVIAQTQGLVYETLTNGTCEGMDANEYKAYEMGIQNTLSALRAILETDDAAYAVHMNGLDFQMEFDLEDLFNTLDLLDDCELD